MSSFINNMQNLAIDSSNKNDDNKKIKEEEQKKRMDEKKDALMIKLTDLYHEKIRSAIERASLNGSREKYMNFNYQYTRLDKLVKNLTSYFSKINLSLFNSVVPLEI